jgi:hypothetical protein
MTGRLWRPDQPGDYHLEWMCALSDDVRTGWPRPGDDRRASLRPRPDDGRPRGGVPHAAPMGGDGPEPHFSDSQ